MSTEIIWIISIVSGLCYVFIGLNFAMNSIGARDSWEYQYNDNGMETFMRATLFPWSWTMAILFDVFSKRNIDDKKPGLDPHGSWNRLYYTFMAVGWPIKFAVNLVGLIVLIVALIVCIITVRVKERKEHQRSKQSKDVD